MKQLYSLILLGLITAFCSTNALAQGKETAKELSTSEWKSLITHDNVSVDYRFTNCDLERGMDAQLVLLRINNKNNDDVTVEWDLELFYNDVCKTCGYDEYHRTYTLKANSSIEGQCTVYDTDQLTLHVKYLVEAYAKEVLTNFKLANVKVTH